MSLKDQILKFESTPAREPVTINGQTVYVREMNGIERDAYEADQLAASRAGKGLDNFRARLLVRVLVDESGARIFSDADADTLGALPARQLRKAFDIASKLNALTPEDEAELVKNS